MNLDFSEDGTFAVDMEEPLNEVLRGLPEDMNGMATTPALDHLFKTRGNVLTLNKERAELFHCVTIQVLFVAQFDRPGLRMAIYFLIKRVREDTTDEDGYMKFARVVKHIRRFKFLCLTTEATYLDQNH